MNGKEQKGLKSSFELFPSGERDILQLAVVILC